MRTWTAHLRHEAEPVLLREGFSWGACVFGPLWLAAQRAWVPAVLNLAIGILIVLLASNTMTPILLVGLAWLIGLTGRDLVRWSMTHRGYVESHVLIARSEVDALARLLANRPDLVSRFGADVRL